jgi:hypothetical protein
MLSIAVPKDKNKIARQLKALEYQIARDTVDKTEKYT